VFLHIGLAKSGTSYIQAVLAANKSQLADRCGLLFPGERWGDQVKAARDIRGTSSDEDASLGAWPRLAQEMAEWQGDSVVSMEWLSAATAAQAARIAKTLAPTPVEVIVTVRDLARTIPAAWQESLQNKKVASWPEFLDAVTADKPRETPPGRRFWKQQDLGKILRTWRRALPNGRLHVIVLPPPGAPPTELWSRFSSVLGIDGTAFDASAEGANVSLGRESAELMLRLNRAALAAGIEHRAYNDMLKQALAKRGLAKRRALERPLYGIPPALEEWTRARTVDRVEAIKRSRAEVVGSLDDLEPRFEPLGVPQDVPPCEDLLEAALAGFVAIAQDEGRELQELRDSHALLLQRLEDSGRGSDPPGGLSEAGSGRQVLARVRRIAHR
jgi:hypothetical protein